jgi:hypothetical protein
MGDVVQVKIAMRDHPEFHPALSPGVPALVCCVLTHGTAS